MDKIQRCDIFGSDRHYEEAQKSNNAEFAAFLKTLIRKCIPYEDSEEKINTKIADLEKGVEYGKNKKRF